jgi:CBS domain-containing protein
MKTVNQILEGKGRSVHSVAPEASVYEALTLMARENIGALVVLEGSRLCGVISERDYARKVVLLGRFSKDTPVRDIMSGQVVCVRLEDGVETCMGLMTQQRIRHLPVVEGDRVVGMLSIGDVVKSVIDEQQFAIEQLEQYIMGTR